MLSNAAKTVLDKLQKESICIEIDSRKLIVYTCPLTKEISKGVVELLNEGHIQRELFGNRKVLVLGIWYPIRQWLGEVLKPAQEYEILLQRYSQSQQAIVKQVFEAFAGLREKGNVAITVLVTQLKAYKMYPISIVVQSLEAYLNSECWKKGAGERYVLGIMRSNLKNASLEEAPIDHAQQEQKWRMKGEVVRNKTIDIKKEKARESQLILKLAKELYNVSCLKELTEMQLTKLIEKAKGNV